MLEMLVGFVAVVFLFAGVVTLISKVLMWGQMREVYTEPRIYRTTPQEGCSGGACGLKAIHDNDRGQSQEEASDVPVRQSYPTREAAPVIPVYREEPTELPAGNYPALPEGAIQGEIAAHHGNRYYEIRRE